jgi:hypothetical protein
VGNVHVAIETHSAAFAQAVCLGIVSPALKKESVALRSTDRRGRLAP